MIEDDVNVDENELLDCCSGRKVENRVDTVNISIHDIISSINTTAEQPGDDGDGQE